MEILTMMASRMFFLMSSIFRHFSLSLKPWTCRMRICLTIVDLPDSPAPSNSSRCVARYTCLSILSCLLIRSLMRFFSRLSSAPPAACCESLLPKQPMAAREDHQQPAPFSAAPGPHSGPVATVAVVVHAPLTDRPLSSHSAAAAKTPRRPSSTSLSTSSRSETFEGYVGSAETGRSGLLGTASDGSNALGSRTQLTRSARTAGVGVAISAGCRFIENSEGIGRAQRIKMAPLFAMFRLEANHSRAIYTLRSAKIA